MKDWMTRTYKLTNGEPWVFCPVEEAEDSFIGLPIRRPRAEDRVSRAEGIGEAQEVVLGFAPRDNYHDRPSNGTV